MLEMQLHPQIIGKAPKLTDVIKELCSEGTYTPGTSLLSNRSILNLFIVITGKYHTIA